MKILFDQGTPVPLLRHLDLHQIDTAAEGEWSQFKNGELLDKAEAEGYHVIVTTDQNLKHQQDLSHRSISIVVLLSTSWPRIKLKTSQIKDELESIERGSYLEITI